jgi:hypothetical protein
MAAPAVILAVAVAEERAAMVAAVPPEAAAGASGWVQMEARRVQTVRLEF